jgi:hypothetical protein
VIVFLFKIFKEGKMDRVLTSRKLWVAVAGIVGIVIFGICFDSENALQVTKAVMYIVGAYLIGQGTVDFIHEQKGIAIERLIASRKLWIAVSSIIGVILANAIGYGEEQASQVTKGIVTVAFVYLISQSGVDFTATLKKLRVDNLLTSRKLWVGVASMIGIVLSNAIGFDAETARQVTCGASGVAALYMGSQGAVDISKYILRARG